MAARRPRGALRVIGGAWRGRRLPIADAPGLRPTPDRVRETLFNWLAPTLPGSRCLDLFAGTGILGIEALSRGAARTVFVERDPRLAGQIDAALTRLAATGGDILAQDAAGALRQIHGPFDVVFLDPPFDADAIAPALAALPALLAPGHRVYLEFAADRPPSLPAGWNILRDKRAGDVGYRLATWQTPVQDSAS